jgi:hypothetical protein
MTFFFSLLLLLAFGQGNINGACSTLQARKGLVMYCISQKAWTLFWKIIFAPAFTSHSYGVLGNLVD